MTKIYKEQDIEIKVVSKSTCLKTFPNLDPNEFTDYDNIAIRYVDGKADAYSKDATIDGTPLKYHSITA